MDEAWFGSFIASGQWVFAKTMPESPHWYTLRRTNDHGEFERAVTDIRAYGYDRRYKGHSYISYDFDGWTYWTMGAPLDDTILINRAQLEPGASPVVSGIGSRDEAESRSLASAPVVSFPRAPGRDALSPDQLKRGESMTNETRLLAHLTQRFAPHPEDIATEALAFLLQRSPAMRSAFWNTVKALVPEVPESVSFRTQVAHAEGTRPDIIGFDVAGREVAMIEAKFWAGLTNNQPVAYLERLRANASTPSVLIVVAPKQRLESFWPELLRLSRAAEPFRELRTLVSASHAHVASVTHDISLVLTTWTHVLDGLLAQARSDGDSLMCSDLLQLQSLAQQQDEDAFLPLTSSELGLDFPRRMALLPSLVDDLITVAQNRGFVDRFGLNIAATGYGRYVRIAGTGARIGVAFDLWGHCRETPLWLKLQKWKGEVGTLGEETLRLKPLEDASRLVVQGGELLVPLHMPLGVERGEVLDALVEQVGTVHGFLSSLPVGAVTASQL